jgi:hypothetical protein
MVSPTAAIVSPGWAGAGRVGAAEGVGDATGAEAEFGLGGVAQAAKNINNAAPATNRGRGMARI